MARATRKNVRFRPDIETVREINYSSIMKVVDDKHVYDLFWRAQGDRDGMGTGDKKNLTVVQLLEDVELLAKSGDFLDIIPRTLRLGKVRYEGVIPVNSDERRTIYNPEKILNGLEGKWYSHNVIVIEDNKSLLGKHYHSYDEAFFVPHGAILFLLADSEEPKNPMKICLSSGNRLFIPSHINHVAKNNGDFTIIMGYGSAPFNPTGIIPSNRKVLDVLLSEVEKS